MAKSELRSSKGKVHPASPGSFHIRVSLQASYGGQVGGQEDEGAKDRPSRDSSERSRANNFPIFGFQSALFVSKNINPLNGRRKTFPRLGDEIWLRVSRTDFRVQIRLFCPDLGFGFSPRNVLGAKFLIGFLSLHQGIRDRSLHSVAGLGRGVSVRRVSPLAHGLAVEFGPGLVVLLPSQLEFARVGWAPYLLVQALDWGCRNPNYLRILVRMNFPN
jgi:hypothetical protein